VEGGCHAGALPATALPTVCFGQKFDEDSMAKATALSATLDEQGKRVTVSGLKRVTVSGLALQHQSLAPVSPLR
jgi:hypothetical protein